MSYGKHIQMTMFLSINLTVSKNLEPSIPKLKPKRISAVITSEIGETYIFVNTWDAISFFEFSSSFDLRYHILMFSSTHADI